MTMSPDDPRIDIDDISPIEVFESLLRLYFKHPGPPLVIAIRPPNQYRGGGWSASPRPWHDQERSLPPGTVVIPCPYERNEDGKIVGVEKEVEGIDVRWKR